MRRFLVAIAAFAVAAGACSNATEQPTPEPRVEIDPSALPGAVLTAADLGAGWNTEKGPVPSTVQIGGEVGPANIKDAEAQAISAFKKKGGSAYVTNNLFLLATADVARAVIQAHRQADETPRWTQDREDGGKAQYKNNGPVQDVPVLGDETYSARLAVTITDAKGVQTGRKVHYIVYRVDRLLAFVIAQDAAAAVYVRRQEAKVATLAA